MSVGTDMSPEELRVVDACVGPGGDEPAVLMPVSEPARDGEDTISVCTSIGSEDDDWHRDSWSAISCSDGDFETDDLLDDHFNVLDGSDGSAR